MKKISVEASKVRESNKSFFILEKYDNSIQESVLKSLAVLEENAKAVGIPLNEYVAIIAKISL
jgi:hypothetical protein